MEAAVYILKLFIKLIEENCNFEIVVKAVLKIQRIFMEVVKFSV